MARALARDGWAEAVAAVEASGEARVETAGPFSVSYRGAQTQRDPWGSFRDESMDCRDVQTTSCPGHASITSTSQGMPPNCDEIWPHLST